MRAFLAQIERVNPQVNAIVTLRPAGELLADAAAADRRLAAGERRRRAARPADRDQGSEPDARAAHDVRLHAVPQLRADVGRALRRPGAPRRRHRHRQDEHAGVRRGLADVQRAVRRDAQSVRPDARPAAAAAAEPPSRSRAACCRSPTARISAARCAIPRASATSSVSGRRRGACRDSTRAPATRSACTARWRATSTISRCCCRSWPGPTRAIRCRCPSQAARFATCRSAISRARESPGASVSGAIPSSPPSRPSATPRVPCSSTLGCEVSRRRARSRRRRRAVPNVARGGICGDATAAISTRGARKLKDTVVWNIEQGLKLTAGGSRARREPASGARRPRRGVLLERTSFLVLPTVQVLPFPSRSNGCGRSRACRCDTYVDWMASCYAISCLGVPAISVPCGFSPAGLPVGLADRGPPRRAISRCWRSRERSSRRRVCASASPTARRGSIGRSCAPTICRRKPVGDRLHLGQQGVEKIRLARLPRPLAVAEHREVLAVRELVAADEVETFAGRRRARASRGRKPASTRRGDRCDARRALRRADR